MNLALYLVKIQFVEGTYQIEEGGEENSLLSDCLQYICPHREFNVHSIRSLSYLVPLFTVLRNLDPFLRSSSRN